MVGCAILRRRGTRRPHLLLFLVLLITLCSACGSDTTAPASSAQLLQTKLDTLLTNATKGDKFSGAVLIAHDGQIVLSKGYGGSTTPRTRFQIGSLTKQFTAMAIMLLQEQGKLHVQDHLCLSLPSCLPSWRAITLHHLLTHSSGIVLPEVLNSAPTTPQQLIALYQNKPLDFAPGTGFHYSNVGYQLLGYVIQHVAGMSYTDFIKSAILAPLHMDATGFLPLDVGEQSPDWSFTLAAGGLYSTAEDMYRWDQSFSSSTLISQKALNTIFTPYTGDCGADCPDRLQKTRYGYGWFVSQEPHRKIVWHTGNANGYSAYNGYYPASKIAMIVLTDRDSVFNTTYGLFLVGNLEDLVFSYIHS